ncbi:hypothetical protein [Microbulbifer sp. HZ11]|uniref:hypothetical protein n=1 Tax=unclassified Microbulbifer TaxID=2619833 RepID=UPI000691F8A9|nr:hypothetical protein [Microbulbifer sp. HZ11]
MFSSNRMRTLTLASLTCAALSGAAFTQADTVEVPVGEQGYAAEADHLRGKKQEKVTEEFGEPLNIQGPVGEPAITRWEYADFFVYFEYDRVLHTVAKHRG